MDWIVPLSITYGLLWSLVIGLGVSVLRVQRSVTVLQLRLSGRESAGPNIGSAARMLVDDATDAGGERSPFVLDGQATVVWFFSVGCAPCAVHRKTVSSIATDYAGRVRSVVTCVGRSPMVAEFAQDIGGHCTVLADPHRRNADAWSVQVTPFVIVVDEGGRVRRKVARVSRESVKVAVDGVLDSKSPSTPTERGS